MAESIDVHKVFASYFEGCETLAYALSSKLAEGNICLDIKDYDEQLPEILDQKKTKESFADNDMKFWDHGSFADQCNVPKYVNREGEELKPFVVRDGKAYLQRYYEYETRIITNIERLDKNFHIITGGPGSGKTFGISRRLAEMLEKKPDLKIALAAPTGKAAARMNEAIKEFAGNASNKISTVVQDKLFNLKASTLHMLLGSLPDTVFFRQDKETPLPYNVVIVDECSMVDITMMAKLLDAITTETEIFLIGDKDQLASVEAGSVFGDLCRSEKSDLLKGKIEVKKENYRFENNMGIGKFSREIINGTFHDPADYAGDSQITIDSTGSKDLFEQYALLYSEYINEENILEALKKLNWVRFLCVTRENENSVAEVNGRIERFLSGKIPGFKPAKDGAYHNQPIIITQNDYILGLLNGDLGIIRNKKVGKREVLTACFEDRTGKLKEIQAGYLNNFETVFAMTIHKSQGSEFNHAVIILPEKQGDKLLTRELLYTAVTRAKTNEIINHSVALPSTPVLIQASAESLAKCAEKSVSRASGLETRLTLK